MPQNLMGQILEKERGNSVGKSRIRAASHLAVATSQRVDYRPTPMKKLAQPLLDGHSTHRTRDEMALTFDDPLLPCGAAADVLLKNLLRDPLPSARRR